MINDNKYTTNSGPGFVGAPPCGCPHVGCNDDQIAAGQDRTGQAQNGRPQGIAPTETGERVEFRGVLRGGIFFTANHLMYFGVD